MKVGKRRFLSIIYIHIFFLNFSDHFPAIELGLDTVFSSRATFFCGVKSGEHNLI